MHPQLSYSLNSNQSRLSKPSERKLLCPGFPKTGFEEKKPCKYHQGQILLPTLLLIVVTSEKEKRKEIFSENQTEFEGMRRAIEISHKT